MPSHLEKLYQQMYEMTEPECAKSCRISHSCCDEMYCLMAEEFAQESYGIKLERTNHPRLPFMGESGCTVSPHLRPSCTLHTCDVNNLGFHRTDQKWTKKYFKLRAKIDKAELERAST